MLRGQLHRQVLGRSVQQYPQPDCEVLFLSLLGDVVEMHGCFSALWRKTDPPFLTHEERSEPSRYECSLLEALIFPPGRRFEIETG